MRRGRYGVVERSARFAGLIRRYHTWPVSREQTVAEHQFHVMRIYCEVFGPPSPAVWVRMLYDDLGEMRTGDLPMYAKWGLSTELRAELKAREAAGVALMAPFPIPQLIASEAYRIKLCDVAEMWEFAHEELMRGNRFALPIVNNIATALEQARSMQGYDPKDEELLTVWMSNLEATGWIDNG